MRPFHRRSESPTESEAGTDPSSRQPVPRSARSAWLGLPRWKLGLLSVAFCAGVAGMVFHPEPSASRGHARTVGNPSALQSAADSTTAGESTETYKISETQPSVGFADVPSLPADETGAADASPLRERLGDLSPLLTKLGFSFVVGFAVGYVLLFFVRAAALLAGLVLAALFGLQYAGVVQVNWPSIETNYESALGWLLPRFDALRTFLLENLSSSGSAALGMVSGLMRR